MIEIWGESHLTDLLRERLGEARLVVVSNREPYVHTLEDGQVRCLRPASGLVTALDPVLRASGGLWVAHGGGPADRKVVDAEGKVAVPPEAPRYTLKRVWLTEEEAAGYYHGLANEALWPLCHIAYVRPAFREADWWHYVQVNRHFAKAVLEEIDGEACIWTQDYHLGLLPRLLKEARHEARVGHFWHIPWPTPEVFRLAPWRRELLEGLLGADVLGFHIRSHCDNFLDTVARELEARVDRETSTVIYRGHATRVRPFPISVDFERISGEAEGSAVRGEMERLRTRYGLHHELIGLGLDRIDYTKGIPERLHAVERFLQMFPEYRRRFVFCQAGVPSRTRLARYRALGMRIQRMAREINRRYAGMAADLPHPRAPLPRPDPGPLPDGPLPGGQLAPRRDEPGDQGVHRGPIRRRGNAPPLPVHRGGPRAPRGPPDQPLRRGGDGPASPRRPGDAPRGAAAPHGAAPAHRPRAEHLPLGRDDARRPPPAPAQGAGGLMPSLPERRAPGRTRGP